MEPAYVLQEEVVSSSVPYGYFISNDRKPFSNSTKRFFLNECINHIYMACGDYLPTIPMLFQYDEYMIRHNLDYIISIPSVTMRDILFQRVKRRLFWEPKERIRKCKKPKLNKSQLSEGVFFKRARSILGTRKIPRNYLDEGRQIIHRNLKRKRTEDLPECDAECSKTSVHSNTSGSICQVYQQVIKEIYQQHGCLVCHHTQQAYVNGEEHRVSKRAKKLEDMVDEYNYRELSFAYDEYVAVCSRALLYARDLLYMRVPEEHNIVQYSA